MSHPFENWIDIYRKHKIIWNNHLITYIYTSIPYTSYIDTYIQMVHLRSKHSKHESRSGLDLGKLSSVLAPRMATPIIFVPDIGMLHEIEMDDTISVWEHKYRRRRSTVNRTEFTTALTTRTCRQIIPVQYHLYSIVQSPHFNPQDLNFGVLVAHLQVFKSNVVNLEDQMRKGRLNIYTLQHIFLFRIFEGWLIVYDWAVASRLSCLLLTFLFVLCLAVTKKRA